MRPWRRRRGQPPETKDDPRDLRASRFAVVGWAVALGTMAGVCVFWQRACGDTLITFALSVMVFAYAGLLGVFFAALLTRRGNQTSALLALGTGCVAVVLLEGPLGRFLAGSADPLAFPWRMTLATAASFGVCCLGRRPPARSEAESAQLPPGSCR